MAKTSTQGGNAGLPGLPFALASPDQLFKACQPFVGGLTELNGDMLTRWLEFNRQWTSFLTRRLEDDVALVHHLAKCSNPQEVFDSYSAFFHKAFSDYQGEVAHLMQIGATSLTVTPSTLEQRLPSEAPGTRVAA